MLSKIVSFRDTTSVKHCSEIALVYEARYKHIHFMNILVAVLEVMSQVFCGKRLGWAVGKVSSGN